MKNMESKEISPRIACVPIFAASVYSYKLQPKQRRAPLRNKMPEKSIQISYYYFLIKLFSVKKVFESFHGISFNLIVGYFLHMDFDDDVGLKVEYK